MLSQRSRLRRHLGADGYRYLLTAATAFQRLLPHATISRWQELDDSAKAARWGSSERRMIRICIDLGAFAGRSLHAEITRRTAPRGVGSVARTLDAREFDLCSRIASKATQTLNNPAILQSPETLAALRSRFDEDVVADHLKAHHKLQLDLRALFESIRMLAGQTYENKSVSLGCIVDPNEPGDGELRFPDDFLESKKFKALTDGFRTAYLISTAGGLLRLVDLERSERGLKTTDREFFPEWSEHLARLSRFGRCGIALTRTGDILVFGDGSLRFAYRFGRWRYLNHAHIVDLLKNIARVQNVAPRKVAAVAKSAYRTALDVSFRRTGGLIVVLRAVRLLRSLVRLGDALEDGRRTASDRALDRALPGLYVQTIPRRVLAELAGLDGALVFANSGELLAYSAILRPRRQGKIRGAEGSRTKAAIGASMFGLAVKISSDGGIDVFTQGKKALVV